MSFRAIDLGENLLTIEFRKGKKLKEPQNLTNHQYSGRDDLQILRISPIFRSDGTFFHSSQDRGQLTRIEILALRHRQGYPSFPLRESEAGCDDFADFAEFKDQVIQEISSRDQKRSNYFFANLFDFS